ncbi:MAG: hypothetical protein R2724_33980, partial [Bryobacterales bacterium]
EIAERCKAGEQRGDHLPAVGLGTGKSALAIGEGHARAYARLNDAKVGRVIVRAGDAGGGKHPGRRRGTAEGPQPGPPSPAW